MAQGQENGMWKGERASYAAVHIWVNNHFGRPQKCESCNTTENRMYHWANLSGTYSRERSDWLRLCVPCHKGNDVKALGGKIKARAPKPQPSKVCTECSTEFYKNPKLSSKQWEATTLCSKACSALSTGRKIKGTKQSEATRALKTEKLKERWATNREWRERVTASMIGNQYARKQK